MEVCAGSSHPYFREAVLHVSSPCLEWSPAQLAMRWVSVVVGRLRECYALVISRCYRPGLLPSLRNSSFLLLSHSFPLLLVPFLDLIVNHP